MVFNSWQFIFFFLAVYLVYIYLPRYRWQNYLLLIASYVFYGSWDWRFLSLIWISTIVDYVVGLAMYASSDRFRRKVLLTLSVVTNLGILGFFKYYNFFTENLRILLAGLGIDCLSGRLEIILPVGISFYTFQTMSYTIDIYRGEMKPTRNLADFALFVAFFPQLVAGPIERAKRLLPQFLKKREIDEASFVQGVWLLFWGLYKKICIADNLAFISDRVYAGSGSATCVMAYLGAVAFTIQIYCDFSGYTDIARGCARLLGFDLMRNFDLPFFAENPRDYWRRWHISLSTWLRDYLYVPLGGNRKGRFRTYLNLFLTMTLGGLWHGAAWNYVLWGMYHGVLLMGHRLLLEIEGTSVLLGKQIRTASVKIFLMFNAVVFGFIIFRSSRRVMDEGVLRDDSIRQIMEFLTCYRNGMGGDLASLETLGSILMLSLPLFVIQAFQFRTQDHHFMLETRSVLAKAMIFSVLAFTWLVKGVQSGDAFIYFQF